MKRVIALLLVVGFALQFLLPSSVDASSSKDKHLLIGIGGAVLTVFLWAQPGLPKDGYHVPALRLLSLPIAYISIRSLLKTGSSSRTRRTSSKSTLVQKPAIVKEGDCSVRERYSTQEPYIPLSNRKSAFYSMERE